MIILDLKHVFLSYTLTLSFPVVSPANEFTLACLW